MIILLLLLLIVLKKYWSFSYCNIVSNKNDLLLVHKYISCLIVDEKIINQACRGEKSIISCLIVELS